WIHDCIVAVEVRRVRVAPPCAQAHPRRGRASAHDCVAGRAPPRARHRRITTTLCVLRADAVHRREYDHAQYLPADGAPPWVLKAASPRSMTRNPSSASATTTTHSHRSARRSPPASKTCSKTSLLTSKSTAWIRQRQNFSSPKRPSAQSS